MLPLGKDILSLVCVLWAVPAWFHDCSRDPGFHSIGEFGACTCGTLNWKHLDKIRAERVYCSTRVVPPTKEDAGVLILSFCNDVVREFLAGNACPSKGWCTVSTFVLVLWDILK